MSPVTLPPAYTPAPQRPGTVTAVAILSLLMGIFCGCGSLYTLAAPSMLQIQQKAMSNIQAQSEGEFSRKKAERVADLNSRRQAATSPEEQERLDAEIEREQARQLPDLSKMIGFKIPAEAKTFYILLGSIGGLLNLIFLVSGIGLFPMMEWARKLNITASALQIILSVGSTVYTMAVISPALTRGVQEMMQEMQKAAPPGEALPPMSEISSLIRMMTGIVPAVGTFIICAWLVAAICMLSTPRVKEAFRAKGAPRPKM